MNLRAMRKALKARGSVEPPIKSIFFLVGKRNPCLIRISRLL